MTRAEWVRFVASGIFWCAVMFAAVSMATAFQRDAQIAAGVAVLAGVVWLTSLVRADLRWQRDASVRVSGEGELPRIGDDTFHTDMRRAAPDDLRPHWDTDVMGAPE